MSINTIMSIRTQRGVGLVEMMIAVTVGLLLMVGVSNAFLAMKNTSTLRQQMATVQANERMAALILQAGIRNAGYFPSTMATTLSAQFPAAATANGSGAFAAGQVISGTGAGAGSDTISVRFVAESSTGSGTGTTVDQGCTSSLVAGDLYVDVFSISGGALTCTETDVTAGTAANTVTLLTGLSGMSVQYGVDVNRGGSQSRYVTGASSMLFTSWWTRIKTVTVNFLFTNPLAGQPGQPGTVSFSQTIPYMVGLQ